MEGLTLSPALIVGVILVFYLFSSIQILNEYERGVIFRLGKLLTQPKGPGVIFVFRPIDRIVRISLRTVVLDVPPQDVITRDNVSVKVNAVVYFRVIDPRRAVVEVENYMYATSQRRPSATGAEALVGEQGRARTAVSTDAAGQVDVRGEIWRAVSREPLPPGQPVRVLGANGLTLVVEPDLLPPEGVSHNAAA